jgi:phosphoglycolate phosphatase
MRNPREERGDGTLAQPPAPTQHKICCRSYHGNTGFRAAADGAAECRRDAGTVARPPPAAHSLGAMPGFLLLFDLDGTLVDSVPDLRAALNELLRERGRPPLSPAEVRHMVGDGVPALVARALAASGADAADRTALPRFLELYEANAARLTRPYPGVPETLMELRRRGYGTAICTNKPQRATIAVVHGLGLAALFDGIAGGDRFSVRKPDPGHILRLIAELGGKPERAAMIGDNENDAAAAEGAVLPLLLMRYGYARRDPATIAADARLDRFAELPAALERLGLVP